MTLIEHANDNFNLATAPGKCIGGVTVSYHHFNLPQVPSWWTCSPQCYTFLNSSRRSNGLRASGHAPRKIWSRHPTYLSAVKWCVDAAPCFLRLTCIIVDCRHRAGVFCFEPSGRRREAFRRGSAGHQVYGKFSIWRYVPLLPIAPTHFLTAKIDSGE